ncbi:MAG: hypothetical protein MUC99_12275 [Anaerolineae bacterium]|nr:hypothetical protein [Anaerolineae bacterium]
MGWFAQIPMGVWGVLALGVALVFALVVPSAEAVARLDGLTFWVVRWFHSLVWVLLAASFFVRAAQRPEWLGLANLLAMAGGLCYVVYLVTVSRAGV